MKNYTRPTVEVVELSVKESLSRVPSGLNPASVSKTQKVLAATTYNRVVSTIRFNNTQQQ